jgi:hypothetical protein
VPSRAVIGQTPSNTGVCCGDSSGAQGISSTFIVVVYAFSLDPHYVHLFSYTRTRTYHTISFLAVIFLIYFLPNSVYIAVLGEDFV